MKRKTMFWRQIYPTMIIGGFWAGIMTQFVWKMIYFPEPLILVVGELIPITALGILAILGIWRLG